MYTVTIIIKRNDFHFSIVMKSEKFYEDVAIASVLFKLGALEAGDSVVNTSFRQDEAITSLDGLMERYG